MFKKFHLEMALVPALVLSNMSSAAKAQELHKGEDIIAHCIAYNSPYPQLDGAHIYVFKAGPVMKVDELFPERLEQTATQFAFSADQSTLTILTNLNFNLVIPKDRNVVGEAFVSGHLKTPIQCVGNW